MKRVTLLCGLLLAMSATVAAAGPGVGIRWLACLSDAGAINQNFACNVNTGANSLVGTFQLGAAGLLQTSGNEVVIDIASSTSTLPAWWQAVGASACRGPNGISMNFVISPSAVNCADWANAGASGGIGAYNIGARGPNTARIVAAIAVPPSALQDLAGGQEYFSFNVLIGHAKTVGTGSCTGCGNSVCIVFNSINLTTPVLANNVKLTGPSNGFDSDFCTWQGGGGVSVGGVAGCGAATPTKNATWGAVKALYH
jgi:hypothetical protein